MKSLRNSPMAIAAAAMIAAPQPAGSDPMPLTVPQVQQPAQPTQPHAPEVAPVTQAPSGASSAPLELRPTTSPSLPQGLSLEAPPQPPPAPPAAEPQAAAATPPARTAAAVTRPQAAPAQAQPAQPRLAPAGASVSVGVQPEYTRLAFQFGSATSVTTQQEGERLDIRFSRAADVDISELRASPPRLVREIRRVSAAGAPLRLQVTLEPGVQQRHFSDSGRVIVDLLPPAPGSQQASANGQMVAPVPARPPVNGVAHVQLVEAANDTMITVAWPAATRAAVFRRGAAIWMLFDAAGRIDLTGVARAGRRHQDIELVRGDGVVGLRIPAPPSIMASAGANGAAWTLTLSARAAQRDAAPVERRVASDGHGSLIAHFAREGAVRWISDPEVGDRFAVALFGGPAKGVDVRRATVEAELLPSAHGAVIEPRSDDIAVTFANGDLVAARGEANSAGAAVAANAPRERTAAQAQLSAALLATENETSQVATPTQTEQLSLVQVRQRIDELERRAAAEGVMEGAPNTARLALARFLLDHDFAAEALGALRLASTNQGDFAEIAPEFKLMRGEAQVMMGHYAQGEADLGASALMQNPVAQLWRGYAAAQRQDWQNARQQLDAGQGALETLPPAWRARFELAMAAASLELNDPAGTQAAIAAALGQTTEPQVRAAAELLQARLTAAGGDNAAALAVFDRLARSPDEETAVRAALEAIHLRRATGVMRAVDAIEPLEALRFRWRGDATELMTVSMLGDVYSELGRWRDALATMRVAADRFSTNLAARQLRADMSGLFERLFLDGEADQLEPIQALGLFYEFSDLTPVGPNGDRMVRLLAGRLVNVDLLEQAEQLLQHQVDERLQGMAKAQVAGDLAAVYLMDHKPDRALVAINTTRMPNMPPALLADRHIIEARALLDLGRLDSAVELVERDRGDNAQRVRAEAAWRARDWDRAAAELRTLVGMRNRAQPLDADGRQQVLRLAVALTLKGDDDAVHGLYREFAGDMAHTDEADAFEVVASGITADGAAIRDVARAVARSDLLDRFMQRLRASMTVDAHGNQLPAPAAPAAPGQPQTPAAPPPAQATTPAAPRNNAAAAGT